jgi:hypothetical protein
MVGAKYRLVAQAEINNKIKLRRTAHLQRIFSFLPMIDCSPFRIISKSVGKGLDAFE